MLFSPALVTPHFTATIDALVHADLRLDVGTELVDGHRHLVPGHLDEHTFIRGLAALAIFDLCQGPVGKDRFAALTATIIPFFPLHEKLVGPGAGGNAH